MTENNKFNFNINKINANLPLLNLESIVIIIKEQIKCLSENAFTITEEFTECDSHNLLLCGVYLNSIFYICKNLKFNYPDVENLLIEEWKTDRDYFQRHFYEIKIKNNENILDIASIIILKSVNGEKFISLIKKYYEETSTKEYFLNMILKFRNQTIEDSLYILINNNPLNVYKREAEVLFGQILIGSEGDFNDTMKFIKKIMLLQCSNIKIEHIFYLIILSNSQHNLYILNGITYSMTVTESEYLPFWSSLFTIINEEYFQQIFKECCLIPVFKRSIISFIQKYLNQVKKIAISEIYAVYPGSSEVSSSSTTGQIFHNIAFHDILKLLYFLILYEENENIIDDIFSECLSRELQLVISSKIAIMNVMNI